jgi:ADP-ribose pyrophosphatase
LPPFRKLGETEVLRGSLIQVATARFEGPDGEQFERDIVHHPGAVVVVPLTGAATVLMVRQYRAAVDAELLELPAGKRDVHGEPTEVTAAASSPRRSAGGPDGSTCSPASTTRPGSPTSCRGCTSLRI